MSNPNPMRNTIEALVRRGAQTRHLTDLGDFVPKGQINAVSITMRGKPLAFLGVSHAKNLHGSEGSPNIVVVSKSAQRLKNAPILTRAELALAKGIALLHEVKRGGGQLRQKIELLRLGRAVLKDGVLRIPVHGTKITEQSVVIV